MKRLLTGLIIFTGILFLEGCTRQFLLSGTGENSVNQLHEIEIGGVKQAIILRGNHIDNPVILALHGGPGYPFFPYLPKNGKGKELEDHFTFIYWEQRGTGKSYSGKIKKSSMNIDQFVEDAHEVIGFSREILGFEKIFVWGHSWGTNIGTLLAARYPGEIYAYIGTGQEADMLINEKTCYKHSLQKTLYSNNLKAYKKLLKIDTTDYKLKDALEVRKWIYAYGGVVYSHGQEKSYIDEDILKLVWNTPEYTFRNKMNILFHPYFSSRSLWNKMKELNLFKLAPEIEVPVYFCLGRHDRIVSSELAELYFNFLRAPAGKELFWFENSAHRPYEEEEDKFFSILVQTILPRHFQPDALQDNGR